MDIIDRSTRHAEGLAGTRRIRSETPIAGSRDHEPETGLHAVRLDHCRRGRTGVAARNGGADAYARRHFPHPGLDLVCDAQTREQAGDIKAARAS